ncbi:hypothetical protein [Sphingobium sp. TomTYG45]
MALQNLLLWRFLNVMPGWLYALAILLVGITAWSVAKDRPIHTLATSVVDQQALSLRRLSLLALVALVIFVLGGEGRFFYANYDWQVRDSLLRDLIVYPWPFAYKFDGPIELLRAPLGMYLLPAVAGKALGASEANLALLFQNSVLLALLLGLGSMLFTSRRSRVRALVIIVFFSGMDVIGQWLHSRILGQPFPNHIEQWALIQYSSHITQAFWVPMHALSGWCGAILFLLWREKRITLGQMYVPVPFLMLMSPLGVMGTLPFAAYAGIVTLWRRELRVRDIVLPGIATLLALPAILYLGAGSSAVGLRFMSLPPMLYVVFELLEVVPFLAGAAFIGRVSAGERGTLLLVAVCLLFLPWIQLGDGMDFTMRVSIPALAILSFQVARAFDRPAISSADHRAAAVLTGVLILGFVTGEFEIVRAIVNQIPPRVQCNMATSIYQIPGVSKNSSRATYFTLLGALPGIIRPHPTSVIVPETKRCWDRPWRVRRFETS